jgi:selenocysteine lyase/cysteine desulfurase
MNNPGSVNVERVRKDTPGVADRIFFDNAGASPTPDPVHRRVVEHLELERAVGGYEANRQVNDELEEMYSSAASLLNARVDEIAFIENATRAWDMAFYGIRFRDGDRILTSGAEYSSNYLAFLQMARRYRISIEVIPDDDTGTIDLSALANLLDDRVRLVNLCHAPTSNGLLNPAEKVGALLRDSPALYFLDACQSAGQLPLDIDRIACDVLTTTGRKFLRGPRGTGLLYVRNESLEQLDPPFVDIHSARWTGRNEFRFRPGARRFENWESNVAGRLGLKSALDYCQATGIEAIRSRIDDLAKRLRRRIGNIAGLRVLDRGQEKTGIVTFNVPSMQAESIRLALADKSITVHAQQLEDARLDLDGVAEDLVRASVHYFNTDEEVDRFCAVLTGVIKAG